MKQRQIIRRGTFLVLACISVATLILIGNTSSSVLALVAQFACAIGAASAAFLGFVPESKWHSLTLRLQKFLRPSLIQDDKGLGLLLIFLAVICFGSNVTQCFIRNTTYVDQDEEAYLITALQVEGRGGPRSLVADLYSGSFEEANRHPLYIGMLSIKPTFQAGKFISVILGVLLFLYAVLVLMVRNCGWLAAGVFAMLLASNLTMGKFSTIVGCESLLSFVVLAIWLQSGNVAQELNDHRARDLRWQHGVVAGGLLAVSWLTKGTGLLFAAGYGFWLLSLRFHSKKPKHANGNVVAACEHHPASDPERLPQIKTVLTMMVVIGVSWLVVASPLLARNIQRYSAPFHNVNSWLMFEDQYSDPVALSKEKTVLEAARSYLESHSTADIVQRECKGCIWEGFILLRMLGPAPFDDGRVLFGIPLFAFALIGGMTYADLRRRLLVCWLLVCVPFFAWYVPVAAGERFVMPLMIPILFYSTLGILHVCRQHIRPMAVTVAATGLILTLLAAISDMLMSVL